MPWRSSSRSVWVSILADTPSRCRLSAWVRRGPPRSEQRTSIDHLLPISARMLCDGQSRLKTSAAGLMGWLPKGAYLPRGALELTLCAMWKDTAITRRLGLAAPIVQGPFGSGLSAVDLVVAVSEGGGLGSFGVHHLEGAGIRQVAGDIRARTQRPFALNLWMPLGDSDDPQVSDARWDAACGLLRPYFVELGLPLPARPARFGPRFDEQLETVLELEPAVFSFIFGVPGPDVLERCRGAGICTVGAATT